MISVLGRCPRGARIASCAICELSKDAGALFNHQFGREISVIAANRVDNRVPMRARGKASARDADFEIPNCWHRIQLLFSVPERYPLLLHTVQVSFTSVRSRSNQCVCHNATQPIKIGNLRLEYVPKALFVARRRCHDKTAILDGHRNTSTTRSFAPPKGLSYIIKQRADAAE
jgi:hypothetical protein